MHFLLKSNNLYYDVSESSYNQNTMIYDGVPDEEYDISNLLMTSTLNLESLFNEITIGTESFKPIDKFDNFTIISDEYVELEIQGIKTSNELIVMNYDIINVDTQISQIHNFNIIGTDSNKVVFSFDEGLTWKTYENGFLTLTTTVPLKNYEDLTASDILQWDTFKDEVIYSGVNFSNLSSIDFNSVNFNTIRFAYLINRSAYSISSMIDNLTLLYDEQVHLIKVKSDEIDIRRYSHTIKAIPNFDTTYCEIRVLTHENFELGEEDNRIVLNTPTLAIEQIDQQFILSWDEISNCDYYKLYINGAVVYLGSDLNYLYNIPKRGIYTFSVRAYSHDSNNYKQSNFSNSFYIDLYGYLSTKDSGYIAIRKNGNNYKFISKK